MEYAIIETSGRQYKVHKGLTFEIDNFEVQEGDDILFTKVLLYVSNGSVRVGNPYVDGIKVISKKLNTLKAQRIDVLRFRAKSRYRRVLGHRNFMTRIEIVDIIQQNSSIKTVKEAQTVVKGLRRVKKIGKEVKALK